VERNVRYLDGAAVELPSKGACGMHASVGDRIVIHAHRSGEPDRDGEIVAVQADDGGPPYMVRWAESGHETLLYPGSDATVQQFHSSDVVRRL
jgi:hypothetical protein